MVRFYAAMRDALVVVTDDGVDGADGGADGAGEGGVDSGGGASGQWHLETHLDDHDLECVVASPDHPERALVGTFDAGLYRTTDGGERTEGSRISVDRRSAGGEPNGVRRVSSDERSESDGGDTFERVGEDVLPEAVMSATISPHDPDEVWVGTEPSRVFRSTDWGTTWEERPGVADLPSAEEWYFPPRPHTHHVRWLEPDPADPDRLYVGIEAGALVRTFDAGETWQDRPSGARRDNHSLATHPDAPDRVYAAAGDGYAESRDGGDTWDYPQEGLDHRYCWSIAVDPADPDVRVLSAASGPRSAHSRPGESYVYRKVEDGPWERTMDGLPGPDGLLRAVVEPAGAGEFYALTNHGIYHSTDAGESWGTLDVEWPDRFREQTPRGLAVV